MIHAAMPAARDRRALALRRAHAVTGVVPLGAFLVEHLLVNAGALGGQRRFDRWTGLTRESGIVTALEVVFVLLPLAYHALYGAALALRAKPSAELDPMRSRRLAITMRAAGVVTLVFVLAHLWEYRIKHAFFGLAPASIYTLLAERMSTTWGGVPWIALGYVAGIAATTFHFAYGLLAARELFGGGESAAGRRRAVIMSSILGGALFLAGATTVIALATGTRLLPADDAGMTPPCGSAEAPPAPGPSSR
jgi:succinate dehydrogenase/fumarate reductase cytochrome b subunit (b558 family)